MKTVTHVPEDCQLCPQTKQGEGPGVRVWSPIGEYISVQLREQVLMCPCLRENLQGTLEQGRSHHMSSMCRRQFLGHVGVTGLALTAGTWVGRAAQLQTRTATRA